MPRVGGRCARHPGVPRARGLCFRCSRSIAVINDHHLDSHMVLPSDRPNPWEEVLDDGDTTDGGSDLP